MDVSNLLGKVRVINAMGPVTRLGASLIDDEILEAMGAAAKLSVDMGALQGFASEVISRYTGAEAGIVTTGATAGLLMGAAACIARLDPLKMSRLPDTAGMRDEFIVSRAHRNSYDHGVRAAGARLVEVGLPDRLNGSGGRDAELWEYQSAICDRTAGILYLARAESRPTLAQLVRMSHDTDIPVLVDAAAELPPTSNLRRFVHEGADLVVFSGGKALGGPAGTGILCGRRALVGSALLQQLDLDGTYEEWAPPPQLIDKDAITGVPRNGIGRSCKVGKEQIVGLLAALQRFARDDDGNRKSRLAGILNALVTALDDVPRVKVRITEDGNHGGLPVAEVCIHQDPGMADALQIARRLRCGRPAVHVDCSLADRGVLVLVPTCLALSDVEEIGMAFDAAMAER
jgi:L-seryl-tRNA(Ser) seleniumtransferase